MLVCTPFTPRLDARHGGKATAQLLLRLAERNDVSLVCLRAPGEAPVDPAIAERCVRVDEVARDARGPLLRRFRWALGLVRGVPPWATDCRSGTFAARLQSALDEGRPDVVEIHLLAMAQYVDAVERRGLPAILVDYDPGSAWAAEVAEGTNGLRRLARNVEVKAWRRYERRLRPLFEAIVVFAERDVRAVAADVGSAEVLRVPLAVELPARAYDPAGVDPPTVLFVGGFSHPPNVDGAVWLANLFPRVAERVPAARLEIVGHEPGPEVRRLATESISVHASVPDVAPYLERAAVVAAPIRIGGSMRMKVLEALAAGKAVLATPRAAEGLEHLAGEQLVIAGDEDAFVEALVELLLDRDRRRALGERARHWAEQNLGWTDGVVAFERLYDSLSERR